MTFNHIKPNWQAIINVVATLKAVEFTRRNNQIIFLSVFEGIHLLN